MVETAMVETRQYRRFGPAGCGLALALLATIGPPDRAAGEAQAASPSLPGRELQLTYEMPERPGEKVPYRVYLPGGWKADAAAPMVVVLHGYAATAASPFDDAGGALQREADRHGFVIVAPNGYNGMADYGANLPLPSALPARAAPRAMTPQAESALAQADVLHVIDRAMADYRINPARVYVMGNSMGMTGVLHLARSFPEKWCAISASDGPPWPGYPVERLRSIGGVLFVHGGRDTLAKSADTQRLAARARAAGVRARMHLVPDGTHGDAWVRYLPETFDFFAAHRCSGRRR